MKIIVLHDRYDNEPVIVRPDAISMIRQENDEGKKYSNIVVEGIATDIKETIGAVMVKIKRAESEVEK